MDTRPDGAEDSGGRRIGRRTVLGALGLGVGGVALGSKVSSIVDAIVPANGVTAYLPGANRFRIYTVVSFRPQRSHQAYRLTVDGLVDRELSLTWDQLRTELPQTRLTRDFQCVTGWRVPGVHWRGVRVGDVLDRAGVQAGATHL